MCGYVAMVESVYCAVCTESFHQMDTFTQIKILAQVNLNRETHIQTRKSTHNTNTYVKNIEGTKKCYAQCGKFSGKYTRVKQSPLQKLVSFWMCGLNKLQPAVNH
jgi:hypothetical protein